MAERLGSLEIDDQLKAVGLLDRQVGGLRAVEDLHHDPRPLEGHPAIAAIRCAPGTASMRMSWRLPSSSGESRLIPVMLPPGRANDGTNPSSTMSSLMPISGTVRVSACSARRGGAGPATIASGAALSKAAACSARFSSVDSK